MKFTTEQINGNGIVVAYLQQSAIAHTAEQAREAIEQMHSVHGGNIMLQVNAGTWKSLQTIFAGEELPYGAGELRTTNCGKYGIRFYAAMSPDIDEHNRMYREQCEREKAERLAKAEQIKQKMLAEFNEQKKGWYRVKVELTALRPDGGMRRVYRELSGYTIAESKMDAYAKMANKECQDACAEKGLIFEHCSSWNSGDTEVDFVGMKTDEGFSIEAWEEYNNNK